ncbi:cryptochrome/photolyase family protein [Marinobacterium arenosum]|uniref:cryptochrome/photolyase family protein n=1 Tax=Marinobacterium arenosum TaxID=2862496 RepID=UPI001C97547D|nr:FAD-binding domain-containing protein [Marinobacterium arenosum]MBY4677498.1 deoxyribodipyrimidine photo-lyase [Marinobacterium arenosum]
MNPTELVWLRNDLRLDDNPALALARAQGPIRVLFCRTPGQWRKYQESPARLGLRAAALSDLASRLAALGIPFSELSVDIFAELPAALASFCRQNGIERLWFNRETPLDEQRRDQAVSERLQAEGVAVTACDYDLLVGVPLYNQQGAPFRVFTPFYKRWLRELDRQYPASPYAEPGSQADSLPPPALSFDWAGPFRDDLWPGEEAAARRRLAQFCEQRLFDYPKLRDYPARPATSTLSPYLANGMLGPRRCLAVIQSRYAELGRDWREDGWLRELAWRDFYRQLLLHFPELSRGKPFRPETERLRWRDDEAGFRAWCEGRTGYPIVDAAMRQLNQTGWMHNRLRMIAASFLCKLLLIDWRRGERYFMNRLVDGEFAANNGGWQWSASTGCDASPYFRVFSPLRQSQNFDPDGSFIRRLVPELAPLDARQIHDPPSDVRRQLGYPAPILDYRAARQRAIAAFEALRDGH